jgi:hypothetical protein
MAVDGKGGWIRWGLVPGAIVVALLIAVALELSLLGLTSLPFRNPEHSARDRTLNRVLTGARRQCSFGNALIGAGGSERGDGAKGVSSRRLAAGYAKSFSGASRQERALIEEACMEGFRRSEKAAGRSS